MDWLTYTIFMYKAHHWALYHMWFQNKSDLYEIDCLYLFTEMDFSSLVK